MATGSRFNWVWQALTIVLIMLVMGGAESSVRAAPSAASVIYLPQIFRGFYTGTGNVTGQVTDVVDSHDLEGAQVCYLSNCVLADTDGFYTLTDVPAGRQGLVASYPEYYPDARYVTVMGQGQTVPLDFALSPSLVIGDIYLRAILFWETPLDWPSEVADDLDMYLFLHNTVYNNIITIFSDPFSEINRGDCTTSPLACIENWAGTAPGPETMAIRSLMVAHDYYFGILNVNQLILPGVPSITETSAYVVMLTEYGDEIARYNVPTTGTGDFWYLYSMTPDGVVTLRNCITTFYGNDVLPTCP